MARGQQRHQEHKAAVAALGRQLSRRARNRCELCQESTSLVVAEISPVVPEEPTVERAAMLCSRCAQLVSGGPLPDDSTLRFLEESVWAELLPVQLPAVRMTRRLASVGVGWAISALDTLYLDPEVEALIEQ
jgi:protein PhnA